MTTRREVLSTLGLGSLATAAGALIAPTSAARATDTSPASAAPDARHAYTPVRTLNGWALPYALRDGVNEFHLVAEEIDHEFAPGCRAKCWGYNGTTPGPTIAAVEGDRVRILVTNRLREATSGTGMGSIYQAAWMASPV